MKYNASPSDQLFVSCIVAGLLPCCEVLNMDSLVPGCLALTPQQKGLFRTKAFLTEPSDVLLCWYNLITWIVNRRIKVQIRPRINLRLPSTISIINAFPTQDTFCTDIRQRNAIISNIVQCPHTIFHKVESMVRPAVPFAQIGVAHDFLCGHFSTLFDIQGDRADEHRHTSPFWGPWSAVFRLFPAVCWS